MTVSVTKMTATSMAVLIMISGFAVLNLFTTNSRANPVSPFYPKSGKILDGVVNFTCNSTNADSVELRIDGNIIATMSGGPTWFYEIDTSGWNDGAHIIRYDSKGATTDNIISIPVKFDNSGPSITNATTLYPPAQETAKPGDQVTVTARVIESVSTLSSVKCQASMIGGGSDLPMYDDGLHNDGAPNDDLYGTEPLNVTVGGGYRAAYVHATDSMGNVRNVTVSCNVDMYEPTILEIDTILPAGQTAVKNGDTIRVTAKAFDYKILISEQVERKPLDVVLVLDNSGSMAGSNGSGGMRWDDLEYASTTFINRLAEDDRCAIVAFDLQSGGGYEDAKQYSTFLEMSEVYNDPQGTSYTSTGRNVSKYIITQDDNIHLTRANGRPNCNTPIWDSIGTAIQFAINNRRADAVPVVIAMTDGADTVGMTGYETGSETYCPGAADNAGSQTWTVSGGCIWGSPMRTYPSIQRELDNLPLNELTTITFGGTQPERTRTGLLNASIPVFTIGLGITPQGSDIGEPQYLSPAENSYKYTTEFDLKSIGETSLGGKYYYAPSSTDLYDIYTNVSEVIQEFGVSTLGIEQPRGIGSIQADFTSIGILLKVNMFDDGMHSDGKAEDSIYGSELATVNSLDSGVLVFQVEGTDLAGNINGTQYTLKLDNTQPSVAWINTSYPPGRDKAQDGYSIYVVANCSDRDTGLGNVYLDASGIGGATEVPMRDDGTGNDMYAYDGDYTSDNVTVTTGLQSGVFTYTVNAYDRAGNLGSQSGNIDIHNDVDIILSNLAADDIISGNFQIIANITDPDGITDTVSNPRYRVDANPWYDMALLSGTNFEATIDTNLYLDGEHTLHVNAKDPYGAESTYDLTFMIDNTAPQQSVIITPIVDEYIEGLYSFRVSATDAVGMDNVNITITNGTGDEVVSNSSMGYNSESGYYVLVLATSNLPDGSYSARAYAWDKADQSRTSTLISFHIDNNEPSMTISNPGEGQIVNGTVRMNISMEETFLDTLQYNVDSYGWIDHTTDWNTTLIDDGIHSLRIRARDKAGHETLETLIVIVDNHHPKCRLNLPAGNQFIGGIYTFGAIVSDEVGLDRVRAVMNNSRNGQEVMNVTMSYNSGTGYYETIFDTTGVADGNYSAAIYAWDLAGNLTISDIVDFQVDNNAPFLSINSPREGDIVSDSVPINITVTGEPFLKYLQYNIDSSGWVNTSTPWNTSAISDGDHIVDIRGIDFTGRESTGRIKVTVDNNDPEAHFISPAFGEYISGNYVFRINGMDDVGVKNVRLFMLGDQYNATYNTQTSSYDVMVDTTVWGDGYDFITCRITDEADREVIIGPRDYYIDNYGPGIDINYPTDMGYVNGSVDLNLTLWDHYSSESICQYNVDNKGWVTLGQGGGQQNQYNWFQGSWNTLDVADGTHSVTIRGTDPAGHVTQYTISVVVDNHDPACEIHSPLENQYMENMVTFKIRAYDEVGISRVVLSIFDDLVNASYNTLTGYYEYTLDTTVILEDGLQTISAVAHDLSGKTAMDGPVLFNLDNTPPKLVIYSPRNFQHLNGSVIINATTIESYPLPTEYNVDSSGWHDIGVPWDTTEINDGTHSVSIRARDAIGHEITETITVVVDNHLPLCTIHSPSEGEFVEGSVTFRILATDALGIEKVELEIFTSSPHEKVVAAIHNSVSNYYEYTQSLRGIMDGTYKVKVTATDRSQNSVTLDDVSFNVDGNYPTLTINKPSDGEHITGYSAMNMSSQDAFDTEMEYSIDKGVWTKVTWTGLNLWDTTAYNDGAHSIEVRAVDEAGHSTVRTLAIFVDNSIPDLNMVRPTALDYLTGAVTVKAYVHDTVAVESVAVSVDNGTSINMYVNPTTGLFEASLDTTKYTDGAHTVVMVARDRVGNSNVKMAHVNFNNLGPDVLLDRIPGKGKGQIEFRVDNDNNASRMFVNIDGTDWKEMSFDDEDNSFWYIWSTGVDDNGRHTYQIKAVDEHGNERIRSDVIKVENDVSFLAKLSNALTLILFIMLLLFVGVVIFVLIRTGRAKEWIMGNKQPSGEKKEKEMEKKKAKGTEKADQKEEEKAGKVKSKWLGDDRKAPVKAKKLLVRKRTAVSRKKKGRYSEAAEDVEEFGGWIEDSTEEDDEDEEEGEYGQFREMKFRKKRKGWPEKSESRKGRYRAAADDMEDMEGWVDDGVTEEDLEEGVSDDQWEDFMNVSSTWEEDDTDRDHADEGEDSDSDDGYSNEGEEDDSDDGYSHEEEEDDSDDGYSDEEEEEQDTYSGTASEYDEDSSNSGFIE